MATNGVIPTFFLNEQIINTESDICAYILKFLFWNPGSTSNQIESTLLSMRKLSATYAEDINTFPTNLAMKMTEVLERYHQGWKCYVDITDRNDEAKTYGLIMKIVDHRGVNILTTESLMVKDGYLTIRNEMEDTHTFNNSRSPRKAETSYSDINMENARIYKEKMEAQRAAERLKEEKEARKESNATEQASALKTANDAKTFLEELRASVKTENERAEALAQAKKEFPNHD